MNKLTTTLKKYSTVPSKDFLGNSIDIGDVVLICQHSRFKVGKVVSLSDKGMTITCERVNQVSRKWDRQTQTSVDYTRMDVVNTIPWRDRHSLEYVKQALAKHNGVIRLPVYRINNDVIPETINLTKLNLYHESTQD